MKKYCEWKLHDGYEYDYYHTSCQDDFIFDDGTPKDNHFKYCPFCGKEIKVVENKE